MRSYTREELFELAGAHALGATTAEESAAIESAMVTNPELAAEVASFRDVTASMARQESLVPSPALRSEFMQRVSASKIATIAPSDPAAMIPRSPRLSAGLVAAVTFAVAMGAWNLKLQRTGVAREAAVDSLARQLAVASEDAQHRHTQLNTILEGEKDVYLVHMKNIDTVTGPGMQFFWNQRQNRGLLHAFRLKPAPTGRTYQLWLVVDGNPVSATVFNSAPDGHALVTDIQLPATVEGVTDILLTEEPTGGSPGPTTPPFVGGKLRTL